MTSLRKLGLRGVRSYSQQSEESIEFLKPLTIIVGANGAGKTSIIESLKFATTGALPPLSDGGKCWAADTLLMQYDGTTKRVQNIAVDDLLMGDDSTPRRVLPGSLVRGRGQLYRVTSNNHGRDSWECNADHILVLRLSLRPWATKANALHGRWIVVGYELAPGADDHAAGQRSMLPRQVIFRSNLTERQAIAECDILRAAYQPLTFECTVRDFMTLRNHTIRAKCMMFQPPLVHFPPPFLTLLERLQGCVDIDVIFTPDLVRRTAWLLGMWVADGSSTQAIIHQIGANVRKPTHSHQPVIDSVMSWLRCVYPSESDATIAARQKRNKVTTAGNFAYNLHCGVVLRQLLQSYGMLGNKVIPPELLTESHDIRRALLEGVIDGDGYLKQSGGFELPAKERRVIDCYVHLARGLGYRVGPVSDHAQMRDETGETVSGWQINITGAEIDQLTMVLPYKRCLGAYPSSCQRCDGFSIVKSGVADYFGFQLDGNGRCLMGDFVVTHNSFVHDPKMEGTNLIKAQVKLSFVTADDKTVLAIRNFQLSQKQAKREFKGMEAVLSTKDEDGRETSVSHKCADIEKLVPQLMGVSPAVLENVIFCHQEDSLWPLSDGKSLKVKFDDIFAATRYTKALENIAKLRKEKAAEIKLMEVELKSIESNVEHAHKLEDDLEAAKSSIAAKASESDRVGEEVKSIESRLVKLGAKQEEIRRIQDALAGLQAQKDVLVSEKNRANSRMLTDYSDTDEELKAIYDNFRQTQARLVQTIEEKAASLKQLEAECVRSEASMGKLSEDLGKLSAQEAEYRRKKQELTELAARLNSSSSSSSPTVGGSTVGHAHLLASLELSFQSKQSDLQSAKEDAQSTDTKFEAGLSALKREESAITEQVKIKTAQMEKCRAKRAELIRQMGELESSARALQSIQDQLRTGEAQLASLTRSHEPDAASMKSQIDAKMRSIQSNTQKLSVLSAQRKQLASQAESLAQIKLKRSQLQNLVHHYATALDALRRELEDQHQLDTDTFPAVIDQFDRLADVFDRREDGAEPYQLTRLEQQLKKRHQTSKADARTIGEQVTASTAHVSSLQSQRRGLEGQLQTLQKQLDLHRSEFIAADAEPLFSGTQAQLEEEISKANKLFEKASNEQMLGSSAKLMYKRFIGIARDSHKCYLCNRDFASTAEESQFIQSNTEKMDRLVSAEKADRNKAATKATKTRLEQMQALMPIYHAAQQLQTKDRPQLESQLAQLATDITVAAAHKSSLEVEWKEVRDREESGLELIKNAGSVARLFGELQHLYSGLRASERRLQEEASAAAASSGTSSAQNLEEVANEYESIEKLNVQLQRECNALQEKLESSRTEKQRLVDRVNRLRDESNQLTRIGDDKERLKKDEAENNAVYAGLKADVNKVSDRLPSVQSQLTSLLREREESRVRNVSVESRLRSDLSSMQRELDTIRQLMRDVERFEQQMQDRAEMKQDMMSKQAALTEMRQERARITKEIQADRERAAQNEKIDSDIKANLDYREREQAIVAHQKKIDAHTNELRAVSGGELLDDLRQLQSRLSRAKEKRSELRGSMQSEGKQCEDLITTLTSDRFRHIDHRYRTKLIDVKTHILANQDLDTYHRALDKALMTFHSLKMKEINETLKDYWRTVYKGADIDEIYIVSDGAIVGTRRNYNYRVVMKQGDTELDMRGRCSAGQKVLASLLIRLALADTFCSQCSVLALDEPTTNLDHKNITAFAQALNQIIERRRAQSNFQLIVITHDETFVDEIGKRAHAEYYYRVYKDGAQHSKIRKQLIDHEEEH